MSYKSLYRKYRPQTLNDVVGQKHVVEILEKSVNKEKISHAYLFCGPRGTGKTSLAKIFSRAVNCTSNSEVICGVCDNCMAMNQNTHPDVVEIDAASNNGVEEIRNIIEKVKYNPMLGKYKVYIIDEVHMLSQGAFNALLKTLEEPPKHVIFILATTEVHKVLPTIISRCQRFDFTRIQDKDIASLLDRILKQEGESAEAGVTEIIASLSGGGLRNALTILEQAIVLADGQITRQQIFESNGIVTAEDKMHLFESFMKQDMEGLLNLIEMLKAQSVHFDLLLLDLVRNLKDSLIYSRLKTLNYIDENNLKFLSYLDENYTDAMRLQFIDKLLDYIGKMKFTQNPDLYFEVAIVDLFNLHDNASQVETHPVGKEKPVAKQAKESTQDPQIVVQKPQAVVEAAPMQDPSLDVYSNDKEDAFETFEEDIEINENIENDEEILTESKPMEINQELILRLMVSADKERRFVDSQRFENLENYKYDANWGRCERLLRGGQIVLSSGYFTVVALKNEIEVRELREARNSESLAQFSKVLFEKESPILVVSIEEFQESVDMFRTLAGSNNLPEGIMEAEIKKLFVDTIETKEDKQLELLSDLFGDTLKIEE